MRKMPKILRNKFQNFAKGSALVIGLLLAATQADAMCRGTPVIKLSDGSTGCVIKKEPTEITRTRSMVGAGAPARLSSAMNGAVVEINYAGENAGSKISRTLVAKRAKEICLTFNKELLEEVKKPGNPFMVVVQTWGKNPQSAKRTFFTKTCWIKRGKRP
jgi:hypothetical protein